MNLNTVRLEGFWGSSSRLYDVADSLGLLLMAGWSCQWEWKEYLGKPADERFGGITSPADIALVNEYLRDQVLWLRNHPCIFVWVLGSDKLPCPALERMYDTTLAACDPFRPSLKACKMLHSEISGSSAVKMAGPYEYVTPNYWYLNTKQGGAFGFNTETGPGAQVPPLSSITTMLPADRLWPINPSWDYHCGRNEFNRIERYREALNARYGASTSAADFTAWAQIVNYEALRPMFESFRSRKSTATGVIQWMMNAAWPKLFWQLYDYYLMPNGAFYAARKANQPLSLVYDYGSRQIHLVNDTLAGFNGLQARIRILDLQGKEVFTKQVTADIGPNDSKPIADLSPVKTPAPVYFCDLRLIDRSGRQIADNFYWLSQREDTLDEKRTNWYVTPNRAWADFSALRKQSPATVSMTQADRWNNGMFESEVSLFNTGTTLAFGLELQLSDSLGKPVVPVLWDDNYLTLLPGEKRTVRVQAPATKATDRALRISLAGLNLSSKGR
jgi:exo-1,4-beta-D-glucosaminidase